MKKEPRSLTPRYSLTQFAYWTAHTGGTSFAAAFLLEKGLPSGIVGSMLAVGGLLSCVTQPFMAARADRARSNIVNPMMILLTVVSSLCFGLQLLPNLPPMVYGLLYMTAMWCSDAIVPLINTLSVSYSQAGYPVNYGMARSIGSVASAVSSLALGHIIAGLGITRMIWFLIGSQICSILILLGYPRIQKSVLHQETDESCTVPQFFVRYKWYCISLLGVLFLGMYLSMTENYMIAIMGRLGGDSSHVGNALFISSISTVPVIFFFSRIRKKISDPWLLKISAMTFLLRAVLVLSARYIPMIYLIQLLHTTSYAFLAPTQVYYAAAHTRPADITKGQAFITAAYALGCSAGNFAGGILLNLSVTSILLAGVVMALAGTIVFFLTTNKSDL